MPSTYTLNNGIELIATGEQSGTWGDTTNVNLGLIDTALDGQVTITLPAAGSSGSPNALAISDGSASDGRNRLIIFTDGGDLGATAFVQLTPNDAEKIVYIRNNLTGGRALTLFQGTYNASNDYEVPAGTTAVVFFNGGGAGAVAANVFNNAFFDSLRLGAVSVTAILDEDNMASDSATALATQQSIKAYVDAQVGANNELSEVLANGNTSGGNDIQMTTTDEVQFRDTALTIKSSVDGQLDIAADVELEIVAPTLDINASTAVTIDTTTMTMTGSVNVVGDLDVDNLNINGNSIISTNTDGNIALTPNGTGEVDITKVDIDGGTIDGTVIGGSTPAAISGTTGSFSGNLTVDTNTLFVDASNNRVGVGTTSPSERLTIGKNAVDTALSGTGNTQGLHLYARAFGISQIDSLAASVNNSGMSLRTYNNGTYTAFIENQQGNTTTFATAGSERLRITSTGSVGIGTSSPASSNGNVGRVVQALAEGNTSTSIVASTAGVGPDNAGIFEARATAQTSGSDRIGQVYIGRENTSTTALSGYMAFGTSSSGTFAERMRIDASGNVSIGSTGNEKLNIFGAGSQFINVKNTSTGADAFFGVSSLLGAGFVGTGGTDPLVFSTGNTERARIDTSGNLLVGKTSTSTAGEGAVINANGNNLFTLTDTGAGDTLNVWNDTAGAYRFYVTRGGTIFATNTTVSAISDQRLKENVQDLDAGLNAVMALKPRKFDWKEGKGKNIKGDRGWIAQEFEQVFPDMIDIWKDKAPEGEEPYKSVRADLMPVLVKAIQDQQAIIEALEARITALEA